MDTIGLYGAPWGTLGTTGWVLAAVVLVALGARAVRTDRRARRQRPRPVAVRLGDGALDLLTVAAVAALVVVLARIVLAGAPG